MSFSKSTPATVRFGPSPTGMAHLGNIRTALFNYLAAKSTGGSFILRIDDTDLERNREKYTQIIFDSLNWLGLKEDQLEFQSSNIKEYQEQAMNLLKAGKAKELDNGAIALLLPDNLPASFHDTLSGDISITETNKEQIKQVILLRGMPESNRRNALCRKEIKSGVTTKSLGVPDETKDRIFHSPTYQFASVVDDYFLNIDWIIRGHDHITNTPKQIAIWQQLCNDNARELPKFTHVGLIHKDKKKLSKRDDAASLLWYRDNGYSPMAILNFILRMGWGSKEDNNQPLTLAEMIEIFPTGRMRAAPSNYDLAKLQWYNKKC